MARRKKKNAITLILLLLALVALIGVYVWYSNKPADGKKASDKGNENISLAKVDTKKVTQLHYVGGSDADITFVLKDNIWKSKANPDRPISQENVTSMLSLLSDIKAIRKIADKPDNLADYGLKDPFSYIQATQEDGSTISLTLGDEAVTGDGYYAMVNDSKTVYLLTVNYGSGLNYSDVDFTEKETTPTITATNINYINIDRKDGQDVELKYSDSVKADNTGSTVNKWAYIKPYGRGFSADSAAVTTLQNNYTSFELSKCVDYTGKNFDKYGLKDPAVMIEIGYVEDATTATQTSKQFKLYIGNKDEEGNYYVRLDGSNMVYTMSASSVDKMLQVDTFSLLDTYINIPNINTVDKITAGIDNKEINMTMTHKTTKNSDGKEDIKSTYYYNGKEAEKGAFQSMYKAMVSLKFNAELTDKVDIASKKPIMTLSFHLTGDNEGTVKTSFLPYNDSFYIVDKGTGRYFLVDKRSIDDLAKTIESFQPTSTK